MAHCFQHGLLDRLEHGLLGGFAGGLQLELFCEGLLYLFAQLILLSRLGCQLREDCGLDLFADVVGQHGHQVLTPLCGGEFVKRADIIHPALFLAEHLLKLGSFGFGIIRSRARPRGDLSGELFLHDCPGIARVSLTTHET